MHQAVVADEVEYMSRNYAAVRIFYGHMSYQLLEENKAYGPLDLIGR